MKKMYSFYCCLFLFILSNSYAQDNPLDAVLISPSVQYEADLYNAKGKEQLFNYKMLNILFANKVGTAFGGSNDLSLQKFYTSLDANDKSLSIGANFDTRYGDETKKLSTIFSGGVKIKSKDNFATVYDNGDFQENNIGLTFKISLIGNGIINFSSKNPKKDRKEAVKVHRQWLCEKYEKLAQEFNADELNDFTTKYKELSKFDTEATDYKSALEAKRKKLYVEMAKEEIDYLEKNKMYHFLWDHWYSLEVFVPLGENIYKTTNDVLSTSLKDKNFYAFSATLSANTMLQYSSGESIFLKGKINLKNNNNIIVDNITSDSFQTTSTGIGGTTVVLDSEDGYITNFDQFLTPSLTIEPAFFTLNNTIGISPAIEFNFGTYNKANWKLGIPISLKDKDGKPKVNFEIQWKEINTFNSSSHLVGISANFLFGELIN